jgi:DNA-binding MarR family transcriptional regulator
VKTESVILALQRATHVTLHLLGGELSDLELTPSEINVLGNLADGTDRTVTELGVAVGSRPTTLTGVLDRLERRSLIVRAGRPGDRRAVLIRLTPDGRKTASRIRTTVRDVERRALSDVPPEAVEGARAVLKALAEAAR